MLLSIAVGQTDRIAIGETGVAVLRFLGVALGAANRVIKTVIADEGQTIDTDVVRHGGYAVLRRQQLLSLRCVDTVETGFRNRWTGNPHVDFDAPALRTISTILTEVVPRTMESSTKTTRFP